MIPEGEQPAMFEKRIAVLVVEDEMLIRMDIAESLEDAGFEVFEAASAAEAIEVLCAHTHIRALFTDIDMPGSMDGFKNWLPMCATAGPPIKIIVTSGHRKVEQNALPDPGQFFPKPYDATTHHLIHPAVGLSWLINDGTANSERADQPSIFFRWPAGVAGKRLEAGPVAKRDMAATIADQRFSFLHKKRCRHIVAPADPG